MGKACVGFYVRRPFLRQTVTASLTGGRGGGLGGGGVICGFGHYLLFSNRPALNPRV